MDDGQAIERRLRQRADILQDRKTWPKSANSNKNNDKKRFTRITNFELGIRDELR